MIRSPLPSANLLRSLTLVGIVGCSAILGIEPAKERPAGAAGAAGESTDGGDGGSAQGGSGGTTGTGGTSKGGSSGKGGTAGTSGDAGAAGTGGGGGCDPDETPGDGVFVSPMGSDADGDGSATAPVETIARALEFAAETSVAVVYLDVGTYAESVDFEPDQAGVVIEGGWLRSDTEWQHDCSAEARANTIIASPTNLGVRVRGLSSPGGLRRLTVTTSDNGTAAAGDSGESNYGVFVTGAGTSFAIDDVEVRAGDAGTAGSATGDASSAVPNCANRESATGCSSGNTGSQGDDGPTGEDGTFEESGYATGDGQPGMPGGPGQNGVVGGSGQTENCFPGGCTCPSPGCGTTGNRDVPTSGGHGICGCGGRGGSGGARGLGGGASVGVFVSGDGVTVRIIGSSIRSASGGSGLTGRSGAAGADGTTGAAGGVGNCNDTCGIDRPPRVNCVNDGCAQASHGLAGGATGGPGGRGGDGGLGGGGSGGHSFSLVVVASATATTDSATMLEAGLPGTGRGGAPSGLAGTIFRD